ncbi:MAG: ArsR/SmtB family transcription factor [Candidatus Sigynarchaeota archaeon]
MKIADLDVVDKKKAQNLSKQPWIFQLLKPRVRLEIFLLLALYHELNVTQISNMLHRSKATVARHLKQLEMQHVLAVDQDNVSNRTIKPLKYRIREEHITDLLTSAPPSVALDPENARKHYVQQLDRIRKTAILVASSMKLITPFVDHLEHVVQELDLEEVERIFADYITRKKLCFRSLLLEEEKLDEFNAIYQEFRDKVVDLANRPVRRESLNDERVVKGVIFIDATLPLLDLLETANLE